MKCGLQGETIFNTNIQKVDWIHAVYKRCWVIFEVCMQGITMV